MSKRDPYAEKRLRKLLDLSKTNPVQFLIAVEKFVREQTDEAAARAAARGIVTVMGKLVKAAHQDLIDSFRERALACGEPWFIVLTFNTDEDDPDSFEQWEVSDPEHGIFRSLTKAKAWVDEVYGGGVDVYGRDDEEDAPDFRDSVVIYDARNDEWYGCEFVGYTKRPRMMVQKLTAEQVA